MEPKRERKVAKRRLKRKDHPGPPDPDSDFARERKLKEPCWRWLQSQTCRHGEHCWFSHDALPPAGPGPGPGHGHNRSSYWEFIEDENVKLPLPIYPSPLPPLTEPRIFEMQEQKIIELTDLVEYLRDKKKKFLQENNRLNNNFILLEKDLKEVKESVENKISHFKRKEAEWHEMEQQLRKNQNDLENETINLTESLHREVSEKETKERELKEKDKKIIKLIEATAKSITTETQLKVSKEKVEKEKLEIMIELRKEIKEYKDKYEKEKKLL